MSQLLAPSIDASLAADFLGEWEDARAAVELELERLARHPADPDALRALYRSLHSMKSNLRMMGFNEGSQLLHAVEDVVEACRGGRLDFNTAFAELIRAVLARTGETSERRLRGQDGDWNALLAHLPALQRIAGESTQVAERSARHALTRIDPDQAATFAVPPEQRERELAMFRQLAGMAEARLHWPHGAIERQARQAMELNVLGGTSLDADQLQVAVLLHDVCMARRPGQDGDASQHPQQAAALLDKLPHWQEAAQIIRQHHEHMDGSGPQRLAGAAIHPGARLLALVDLAEQLQREAEQQGLPRPLVHVLGGVNAESGRRLDPFWVEQFIHWLRQHHVGSHAPG